ncbi:hypothetical protein ECC15_06575 [Helicobacter pylori]|nr:hypothetical protein ECC15_06575 [Helicobacter pylori]
MFKRLLLALRKAFSYLLDKLSHKLRLFQKFKLFFFFFFDLILGVILILFKRKSDDSERKHR